MRFNYTIAMLKYRFGGVEFRFNVLDQTVVSVQLGTFLILSSLKQWNNLINLTQIKEIKERKPKQGYFYLFLVLPLFYCWVYMICTRVTNISVQRIWGYFFLLDGRQQKKSVRASVEHVIAYQIYTKKELICKFVFKLETKMVTVMCKTRWEGNLYFNYRTF